VAERRGAQAAGWREVLIVAAVAVGVVLGAAILTSVLPTDAQRVIFRTPLLIGVLIVGTGFVLWRITARRSDEPPVQARPGSEPPATERSATERSATDRPKAERPASDRTAERPPEP
jgi:uncharacterized membrane protein YfcA